MEPVTDLPPNLQRAKAAARTSAQVSLASLSSSITHPSLAAADLRDKVYRRVLESLANRRLLIRETGEAIPCLLPETGALMVADGFSLLDIAEGESEILNDFENGRSSRFGVTREVPKALRPEYCDEQLIDAGAVVCPGPLLNAFICAQLRTMFIDSALLSVPGFVIQRYTDADGSFESIRLDLDDWLCRQGVILPVREGRRIAALKVFRHLRDTRPFLLKSRHKVEEGYRYAA